MHFKGRGTESNPWWKTGLTVGILSISLVLLLLVVLVEWPKEEQPEVQNPGVIVRIKMPPQIKALAQGKVKSGHNVKKSPGTEPSISKASPPTPPSGEQLGKSLVAENEPGYYKARKGDSLFRIAGHKDVYGDSLKWPSLFRLNMDRLKGMEVTDDFQHKELPEGISLKFVTPREALNNLTKLGQNRWVVNVVSSQNPKEIVPVAITLMKNRYRVYITKVEVKGKEWLRLRAGFFSERQGAARVAKELISMLNAGDAWVVKITKSEQEEFGRF